MFHPCLKAFQSGLLLPHPCAPHGIRAVPELPTSAPGCVKELLRLIPQKPILLFLAPGSASWEAEPVEEAQDREEKL